MQISIASYSFHGLVESGQMNVFGYLESCRYRYNVHVADLWNGLLGKTPDQQLDPAHIAAVRAGMDERGMTCVNFHVDGCHIWEDDAAARDAHHQLALRYLKAAEQLGAKTFRIDTGGRAATWNSEQFDLIVTRMREYAHLAAGFGCRVGPEVHWGTELYLGEMERLAVTVDSPAYGILMHFKEFKDATAAEAERRLAKYVYHTHVDAQTTDTRLNQVIETLVDAGYKGFWGVEHHSGQEEYKHVERQLAKLRLGLIKKFGFV